MNISSPVGQLTASNSGTISNDPIKNSARSVKPVVSEIEKEQSTKKQATPSIVIDEQAIAHYEQSQASLSIQAQSNKDSFSSTNKEQLSSKNEMAVANYQAVDNLAQRESVQKLFGVDLFA